MGKLEGGEWRRAGKSSNRLPKNQGLGVLFSSRGIVTPLHSPGGRWKPEQRDNPPTVERKGGYQERVVGL